MDDLIKEPDRLEFVDSDHIMNYLQNMDEACENSLMGCEENMGAGDTFDKDLAKLNSTEGLLDNLIKSVCSGINDSTLINKEEREGMPTLVDNDSSDMDIIAKSVSLDVIENTQLNEVNVADKLTNEISHASNIFEKQSLGADESYNINEAKKIDSVSFWKSEKTKKETQSTSKDQDDDVIVLDEKEFAVLIKKEKQVADIDDCEIIEEKKPTLSSDAKNSKNENVDRISNVDRETTDYAFHINDNIKQGLSKLTFPSKASFSRSSAQKKKIPSLRPINTRITIGEALEKAQDVQKNVLEEKANAILGKRTIGKTNEFENKGQLSSSCQMLKPVSDDFKESLNETVGVDNGISCLGQLSPGGMSTGSSVRSIEEKMLDTAASSPIQINSPIPFDEQEEMLKAENKLQEKTKVKSIIVGRHSIVNKMSDLLKFTFDHEHFPSSVNMARLAKVVGVTWSQIRNWFTNRRVENKKNGIFPRDKVLDFCPYCSVTLKTEVEQKSHLFAAQHIRKILGTDYVGDVKWKNSPSDRSGGANLHSQNLTTADTNNSLQLPEVEANVESVTNKLGKRWKDSFLLNKKKKCDKVNIVINPAYDSEKAVMEEVKEEYDAESVCKSSVSTSMDSECGEHFQDVIDKMEGINSKHLSLCSNVTEKGPFASGTIINKYVSSSQKGKFLYSKVIGQAYKKGSQVKKPVKRPDHRNKSPSIESNQSLDRGLRVRQKNALSFMEDSLLGYQCPTCYKIFQTEWQMIKHTMTHLLFICDICEKNFVLEHDLKLHLHDHLTVAYEEEKYYCQFSCKICHSLKCECYDTQIHEHKEISKAFERPQKAKRSKRTFSTKPYSGMNDHLRMTYGNYHKYYLQRSNRSISEIQSKLKADKDILPNNIPKKTPQDVQIFDDKEGVGEKEILGDKEIVDNCKEFNSDKTDKTPISSVQPRFSVRKDMLIENCNTAMKPELPCSEVPLVHASSMLSSAPVRKNLTKIEKVSEEPQKKTRGRKAGRKNTATDVCIDADFYYMCEICDSSFYCKAELQEHMFFHRLKSRSRRGNKRILEESEEASKKTKLDDCVEFQGEAETHNFEGFKRFKCPMCKGHFANARDLKRHKTQLHSNNMSSDSLEVLKCNYCEKTYKRERELRRHLKHACPSAPEHLRTALTVGTTLIMLQERGDGPHFTVVNKSLGTLLKSNLSLSFGSGPYKCRYCHVVTKHEREMKDHIWNDCVNTPNIIKKRSQQGTSLEELGFQCQEDEVEDMIMSGVTAAIETDIEEETQVNNSPSGAGSGVSPSSSKSKEPLVCAYCGIWYYRKISLIKHMKDRCIVIPTRDRELLNQGLELCDAVNRHGNSFCEISSPSGDLKLTSSRGLYKKVQGSVYGEKLNSSTELDGSSSEIQNATDISKVSNEDLNKCDAIQEINLSNKENDGVCSNDSEATSSKQEPAINKKNTKQKSTRCNRCHEVFISPDAVLAHSSVHHGPKKGLYKCKLCQDRFQKYKQLREHVWMHTQETPYKCHLCNARYRISDNILDHLLSVHGYHKVHEKNIFKWLPGRNGKYRTVDAPKDDSRTYESEETLEGLDTNLENLAEDMVITDDIWTGNNEDGASSKENVTKNCKIQGQKAETMNDGDENKLNAEDKCKDSKKICDIGNSNISVEIKNQNKNIGLKTNLKGDIKQFGDQTEQESSQIVSNSDTVRKDDTFPPTNSVNKEGRKKVLSSSNDDDGELFSGLSNLDSIIETVNLTDDSFLE